MISISNEINTIFLYLEKLLFHKSANLIVQFFRNGVTSIISFIFDFCILYTLTHYLGVHYLISGAISFLIGHLVNYILSITWVFSERKYNNKPFEFTLFILIGIIGVLLNEVILWTFTDIIQFNYLVSKLFSIVIVYFVNFFVKYYLLFSVSKKK